MEVDGRDVFVLGYSDEVRMLLELLREDHAAFLERVVVVDPRDDVLRRLRSAGIAAVSGDPLDRTTLCRAGMVRASVIVRFTPVAHAERSTALALVQMARRFCPGARLVITAQESEHADELRAAGAASAPVNTRWF
jgi:Trk K+ transport system NAD-binding subunit